MTGSTAVLHWRTHFVSTTSETQSYIVHNVAVIGDITTDLLHRRGRWDPVVQHGGSGLLWKGI